MHICKLLKVHIPPSGVQPLNGYYKLHYSHVFEIVIAQRWGPYKLNLSPQYVDSTSDRQIRRPTYNLVYVVKMPFEFGEIWT